MTNPVPPDLEVLGMTKRFGPLVALKDVNFRLRPGQFHALLGENGAGKSTLVKCIMGYYHPDEGKILLDQQQVTVRSPRDAQALGIGMVYQQFTLIPNMTVLENLVISKAKLKPDHQLAGGRATVDAVYGEDAVQGFSCSSCQFTRSRRKTKS